MPVKSLEGFEPEECFYIPLEREGNTLEIPFERDIISLMNSSRDMQISRERLRQGVKLLIEDCSEGLTPIKVQFHSKNSPQPLFTGDKIEGLSLTTSFSAEKQANSIVFDNKTVFLSNEDSQSNRHLKQHIVKSQFISRIEGSS